MRPFTLLLCALLTAAVAAASVAAGEPANGSLSIEDGKGLVVLDIRGAVLGRLASGTVRVTDATPRDRFGPLVVGKKLVAERINPRTTVYRGQGLRFRMIGGAYRVVIRGDGLSLSAVGRGSVLLLGETKTSTDELGVFSIDGVDCSEEPELCLPLPDLPQRYVLQPRQTESEPGSIR